MNTVKLSFLNKEGIELSAKLSTPIDGKPLAYALFAHCFTCSKNLKAIGNISRALCGKGIAVFRFDFTGLGESDGEFADTNFSSNIEDLVFAANYMQENYAAPQILIGHSLGGAAVLQAASRISSSLAVATIGAPYDPSHVLHLIEGSKKEITESGKAKVDLGGREFIIKKQFLDDLELVEPQSKIASLDKALLVLHSPIDQTVGVNNAADIFLAAKHPKSFVSLDEADHLLMNERDSLYAGELIASWSRKYIKTDAEEDNSLTAVNSVIARTNRGDDFRTDMSLNGHRMLADEPASVGGTNLGATPYEYLLSGLGACTSMTLQMYARRKKWPLESAIVRLEHSKVHANDCGECETEQGKLDVFSRELELVGDLTKEQRERLLEIADKCPVHKTLHSEIIIKTNLKG